MQLLKSIFLGRKSRKDITEAVHASIMAQSLQPIFFGEGKVADSFSGRFEVVALHAAIVMRRLRDFDEAGKELAQSVFNELFSGFDHALREVGTGDLKVGKKVRQIGESFYGRAKAYDEALNAEDKALLSEAILRNLSVDESFADQMMQYSLRLAQSLGEQSEEAMLSGKISWLSPEEVGL